MENKIKHLEFIQETIKRTANNSFLLKGWGMTLIVVLFVFATKDMKDLNFWCVGVALFPILIFWLLDSYFLQQERLYRDLYNKIRTKKEDEIDFSLDTKEFNDNTGNNYMACFFSKTLIPFYLSLIITIIILSLIINS